MEFKEGPALLHHHIAVLYHRLQALGIHVEIYERSLDRSGEYFHFEHGARAFCIRLANGFVIGVSDMTLFNDVLHFEVWCKTSNIALFGERNCRDVCEIRSLLLFWFDEEDMTAFCEMCQAMHLKALEEYKEFWDPIYKSSLTLILCLKKHNIPRDVANMFGRFLVQKTKFPKCEIWGK